MPLLTFCSKVSLNPAHRFLEHCRFKWTAMARSGKLAVLVPFNRDQDGFFFHEHYSVRLLEEIALRVAGATWRI